MLFIIWLVLLCLSQYCIYQTVHFKQHYWETASKMLTETIFKPTTTLFLGLKQEQLGLIQPPQTTAVVQWTLYSPTWIWALLQDRSCRSCGDGEPGGEACRWNLGVIFSKNREVRGSVLWGHRGSSAWWAGWCCDEEGARRRGTGRSPLRARPPASRASCPTGLLPGTRGTPGVSTLSWGVLTQPSTYSQETYSASGLASWQQKDTGPPRQTAESLWDLLLREPPIAELEMLLQC